MSTITVSTRITSDELAKARDGLILKGLKPAQVQTKSQILRFSIYLAMLHCPDPSGIPTKESINILAL
jgi:hypothetical protein